MLLARLDLNEAPEHPQDLSRGNFENVAGVTQPAPAPRFARTPGSIRSEPPRPGEHGRQILRDR